MFCSLTSERVVINEARPAEVPAKRFHIVPRQGVAAGLLCARKNYRLCLFSDLGELGGDALIDDL